MSYNFDNAFSGDVSSLSLESATSNFNTLLYGEQEPVSPELPDEDEGDNVADLQEPETVNRRRRRRSRAEEKEDEESEEDDGDEDENEGAETSGRRRRRRTSSKRTRRIRSRAEEDENDDDVEDEDEDEEEEARSSSRRRRRSRAEESKEEKEEIHEADEEEEKEEKEEKEAETENKRMRARNLRALFEAAKECEDEEGHIDEGLESFIRLSGILGDTVSVGQESLFSDLLPSHQSSVSVDSIRAACFRAEEDLRDHYRRMSAMGVLLV